MAEDKEKLERANEEQANLLTSRYLETPPGQRVDMVQNWESPQAKALCMFVEELKK